MRTDGRTDTRKLTVTFRNFANDPNNARWTAVAQWLMHCGTNRKVAGSIPTGVTGIFH